MYQFFLWLHIVAVISWMAGILYLFRLFVYHKEKGEDDSRIHDLLGLMEFRLYRYITFPAMLVASFAGLSMLFLVPGHFLAKWIWLKLGFVVLLILSTLYAGKICRLFSKRNFTNFSGKKLRLLNEVPTILMLIIVALVVFKPF